MRVCLWTTWSGLWQNFHRSNVFIRRKQLRGVTWSISQGGGLQLFIKHASRLSFATGWDGPESDYTAHASVIANWLKATSPQAGD